MSSIVFIFLDYPNVLDVSCDEDLSDDMTDDIADVEDDDVEEEEGKRDAAFEARQDRLLSMAEYRTEIYDYLRQAEVCVWLFVFLCIILPCCLKETRHACLCNRISV